MLPGAAAAATGEPNLEPDPGEEPPADPEDWSSELAAVELQLRRLGWNRDQESLYLQRAFSHPSRSRLTRYSDLLAYLTALEALPPGADPALAAVPLRRSELLAQGDALLAGLGWGPEQGRRFLEQQLQRSHRRQLSDAQLLAFNMLLESELLGLSAAPMGEAARLEPIHPEAAVQAEAPAATAQGDTAGKDTGQDDIAQDDTAPVAPASDDIALQERDPQGPAAAEAAPEDAPPGERVAAQVASENAAAACAETSAAETTAPAEAPAD